MTPTLFALFLFVQPVPAPLALAPPVLLPDAVTIREARLDQLIERKYARKADSVRWWGRAAVAAIVADIATTAAAENAEEANPLFGGSKEAAIAVNGMIAFWLHDIAKDWERKCEQGRKSACKTWPWKVVAGFRFTVAGWNAAQ